MISFAQCYCLIQFCSLSTARHGTPTAQPIKSAAHRNICFALYFHYFW